MTGALDHWDEDRLGRRQDAVFLYNFLIGQFEKRKEQGRTASYVLNVDADWGGGKTFFLDGLAQDIEEHGHLVARINAWRDDHAQDPYIAIMAAIDRAFAPFVQKPGKIASAWTATKSTGSAIALKVGGAALKGILKKHTGISIDELSDIANNEGNLGELIGVAVEEGVKEAGSQIEKLFDASLQALIESFNRTDEAMSDFRLKLENAVAEVSTKKPSPLFVLVDELDRCRPTYAVQLLERVKHLFDVEGVIFVFATNTDQLQHSITGAYGINFDGFRYLKRFFDRTYVFEDTSNEELITSLCTTLPANKIRAPENNLVQALTLGCKAYGFDLRAIGQVLEMVNVAATAWPHKLPADIVLLFPLCANFYKTGKAEWPSHQLSELASWVWPRTHVHRFEQKVIDGSIHYGNAYRAAVGIFRSMEQIMEFNRPTLREIATDYIYETFSPEWNGVRGVQRDQPSIQTELLGLVANAGRVLNAKEKN